MSFSFRHRRLKGPELHGARQYFWYAIGEVILIFAGITLALAFGNWNEERKVRNLETKALTDIAANLNTNVRHIKGNIKTDTRQISACRRVLEALSQRTPWRDAMGQDLWVCRYIRLPARLCPPGDLPRNSCILQSGDRLETVKYNVVLRLPGIFKGP